MLVIAGSLWKAVHFTAVVRNAYYLPVTYLDWMQNKNYPVPSECGDRDYHLKAIIAIYLHLQTRSPAHALTMSLTMYICYENFVLHTEEIYCIITFVWLLLFDRWAPVKSLAPLSLSPLTENTIFCLSGFVPFSLWWRHSSEKDHSYYWMLY